MALAEVSQVREIGGLDHPDDCQMFRLPDEAALDDLIQRTLDDASAWLETRAGAHYTQTADTAKVRLFTRAEAYLTLHMLTIALKARKVYGTHWAVDSEGSERYEELIDVEWLRQFEMLAEPYLTIELDAPFALPAFVGTDAVDRSSLTSWPCQLEEVLAEAQGAGGLD